MRKIRRTPYHSWLVGKLPEGCRHCVRGRKTVLLVTGLCSSRCWYCPLSARKKGRDVIVANEWWIKKPAEVLEEARLCSSTGAGFTGGDPLYRIDRTVKYIRLFKKRFGKRFHIHLYTTGRSATRRNLRRLYDAGLDEIRFHPDFLKSDFSRSPGLEMALEFDWDVGCEIPVIPGRLKETEKFIDYISSLGVRFLNLNELEISETNVNEMHERGFRAVSDASSAVKGSREAGLKLLQYCARNTRLNVHFCTVKLKDAVQLRNRLKRRAKNVAKEYDIVTGDGLLIRGALYLPELTPSFGYQDKLERLTQQTRRSYLSKLSRTARRLSETLGIPPILLEVDRRRLRILTGAWVAEELADEIKKAGLKPAVVEEYPTWDSLCVDLRML
ncbi:MAG: radical SAM protein [Candidatus Altiarchaeota archaeon]